MVECLAGQQTAIDHKQNSQEAVRLNQPVCQTNYGPEFLTINEINNAVVVLTDILNFSAGSSGHVDLYQLLQEYLLNPEKRKK
jgi:hypothetical protein